MLTKEECEEKLDTLARYCSDSRIGIFPPRIELHDELTAFDNLIKEHFELVEHAKKLQDEVDKYKHDYFSMCDLVENTKAYKLEDLKPGMWVWDDKWEECFEICEVFPKDNEIHILIHQNRINVKRYEPIKFEEGRFFPVTKALEY